MPDNEPAKLPVYAGWNAAAKQFDAPALSVACCVLRGHNLLMGWKLDTDSATGKGGIPGGSLMAGETPRTACQRIVRGEIGLDLEPYYPAWVGLREFPVRGKLQPVYIYVCGLHWGSGRKPDFDKWSDDRIKRYEDGLKWSEPVVGSLSRYQQWRWIEIEAARASPQRLSPVLQQAVEIITRPPPEIAFSFEVTPVPIGPVGKMMEPD